LPGLQHDIGLQVMVKNRVPAEWLEIIAELVGPWSRLVGGVNAIARQPDGL
jgi:hypothetical protein